MEEDLVSAAQRFSEDLLLTTSFEIADTYPELQDSLMAFHGKPCELTRDGFSDCALGVGIDPKHHDKVLELLMWFGFLGVTDNSEEDALYAFRARYNLHKLQSILSRPTSKLIIHPAFRFALDVQE